MEDLLAHLREQRRWPWTTVATTLVVGVGIGAAVGLRASAPLEPETWCEPPQVVLDQTWDDDARERVRSSFLATGQPDAPAMFERTAAVLDDYVETWSDAYTRSCDATYVTRQQSEPRFEAHLRCLQSHRTRLEAAIDALATAQTAEQLQSRLVAPLRLPPVSGCDDLEDYEQALPDDPVLRSRIEELRRLLGVAQTIVDGGDYRAGVDLAAQIVEQSRDLRYPSLLAQSLELLGHVQANMQSVHDAELTLREAISLAAQTGQARTEARAWASLLFVLALKHELVEGHALRFPAENAVRQANDDAILAWLHNAEGILFSESGEDNRVVAAQHMRRSLELKLEVLGSSHIDVGIAWSNLGHAYLELERLQDAHAALDHARSVFAETVGAGHALDQIAIAGQCRYELEVRDYERALPLCTQAAEYFEGALASPITKGRVYFLTAQVFAGVGRLDEARALGRRARTQFAAEDSVETEMVDRWLLAPGPRRTPGHAVATED